MTDGETRQDPTAHVRTNEIEVPGTPEEVWRAIATGPGHAAWLFPADIEPGEGGAMMIHREPYGDAANATVAAWEPPHRFGFREPIGPDAKPLTTEFLIEAKGGGSVWCASSAASTTTVKAGRISSTAPERAGACR